MSVFVFTRTSSSSLSCYQRDNNAIIIYLKSFFCHATTCLFIIILFSLNWMQFFLFQKKCFSFSLFSLFCYLLLFYHDRWSWWKLMTDDNDVDERMSGRWGEWMMSLMSHSFQSRRFSCLGENLGELFMEKSSKKSFHTNIFDI